MEIYVTGYSMVSAIGLNVSNSLENIKSNISGIKEKELDRVGSCNIGTIDISNKELRKQYEIKGEYSRTAILGVVAVKEAIKGINNRHKTNAIRTGLISGTSVGGMDYTEDIYFSFLNKKRYQKSKFKNHSSGTVTKQIANEIGGFLYIDTISTACSSAANAILQGARLIQQGILDRVVVGGTDSLSQFTINGFKSLMIYDDEYCKPFDKNRKGLNLGEGAGYLILESKETIEKTQNKPLVKLTGWCNASDAFHQTASSPEGTGAIISMEGALKMSGLDPNDVDYINAHGTATPNNDLSESMAIKSVFGEDPPPFSSTKPYTGHTLAASGGIESTLSILAIEKGLLYPNLNFTLPIEETMLTPEINYNEGISIKNVISNSFGFGGNNTSLIFSSL